MVNTLHISDEKSSAYKYFRAIVLTGTTLLFLLQPGFSRNNEKVKAAIKETLEQYDAKKYTIQETESTSDKTYVSQWAPNVMDGDNDALSYASDHVRTEYPDMANHLTTMLNSFRDKEHKDATTNLLNKMVANITNPTQKVGAIIGALEYSVFYKSTFWDKYGNKITEQTLKYIEIFDTEYKARFKGYYTRVEASIEQMKKETEQMKKETEQMKKDLKKWLQEIESIMDKFTPNDIQKSEYIKKLVVQTKYLFINAEYTFSSHTRTLFNALP